MTALHFIGFRGDTILFATGEHDQAPGERNFDDINEARHDG